MPAIGASCSLPRVPVKVGLAKRERLRGVVAVSASLCPKQTLASAHCGRGVGAASGHSVILEHLSVRGARQLAQLSLQRVEIDRFGGELGGAVFASEPAAFVVAIGGDETDCLLSVAVFRHRVIDGKPLLFLTFVYHHLHLFTSSRFLLA